MKTTRIDVSIERNILISLIVSNEFCNAIIPIMSKELFSTEYASIISSWVKEYYEHYKQAPKQQIQSIFTLKKNALDDAVVDSIADLLVSLSDNYKNLSNIHNIDYEIETAVKYFKLRSLQILEEQLQEAVIRNDPLRGEATIANYKRVGLPTSESIGILQDTPAIIQAFSEEREIPFHFRGAVDKVISPVMRGDLCAFIGKPKGWKSFALLHTAECAMLDGCRVLFFSLEMRQNQVLRRMWHSLAGQPLQDEKVIMPYFQELRAPDTEGKNGFYSVNKKIIHKSILDLSDISAQQESLRMSNNGGEIKLITLPRFSASIEDIIMYMDNLRYYEGFVPDVVIVDYADILKPSKNSARDEYRHRLNDIWMRLASLAHEYNISVWTATQTNRDGLQGDIELANIAEEFRKIAHCSMLIAINQKKAEREEGVVRLKALIKRDDSISDADEAVVLQQMQIGKFYLDSKLVSEVEPIQDH